MTLELRKLTPGDIPALTVIMKRAFDSDTRLHLGLPEGGPDGYDDGSFLRRWGLHPRANAYCAVSGGALIGCVILWLRPDRHNMLGTIFVDPDCQNRGMGTALWRLVERTYPDALSWTAETPAFSRRNHNFYVNKCGFHVVKIDKPRDAYAASYVLRKEMKRR